MQWNNNLHSSVFIQTFLGITFQWHSAWAFQNSFWRIISRVSLFFSWVFPVDYGELPFAKILKGMLERYFCSSMTSIKWINTWNTNKNKDGLKTDECLIQIDYSMRDITTKTRMRFSQPILILRLSIYIHGRWIFSPQKFCGAGKH